jgi:hypothetical protein
VRAFVEVISALRENHYIDILVVNMGKVRNKKIYTYISIGEARHLSLKIGWFNKG